jgi:hypothetical protein
MALPAITELNSQSFGDQQPVQVGGRAKSYTVPEATHNPNQYATSQAIHLPSAHIGSFGLIAETPGPSVSLR